MHETIEQQMTLRKALAVLATVAVFLLCMLSITLFMASNHRALMAPEHASMLLIFEIAY